MNLVPSMFTNQSLVSQLVLGWHCTHCQHTRNGMWLQSQSHVNCLHSQGANGLKLCCSLQSVGCRKNNWGNLLLLFSWSCLNQRRHFINRRHICRSILPFTGWNGIPSWTTGISWSMRRAEADGFSMSFSGIPQPLVSDAPGLAFAVVFSWNNVTVLGWFRQTQN